MELWFGGMRGGDHGAPSKVRVLILRVKKPSSKQGKGPRALDPVPFEEYPFLVVLDARLCLCDVWFAGPSFAS